MSVNSVIHDFAERLEYSSQLSDEPSWIGFYHRVWPQMLSCVRIDKDSRWQRHGVDRMVILPGGQQFFIDEKKRDRNQKTGKVYDDFLLEEYSNLQRRSVGWTLDTEKRCDFIAYAIPDLGKCYLLPFELLRLTCKHNLQRWKAALKKPTLAQNTTYQTQNWPVNWDDLFASMKRQMHRTFGESGLQLPIPIRDPNQLRFEFGSKASRQ